MPIFLWNPLSIYRRSNLRPNPISNNRTKNGENHVHHLIFATLSLACESGDALVSLIDTSLLLLAMAPAYLAQPEKLPEASPNPVWLLAGLLLLFSVQGYSLFHNGQILGKKVLKIRIVTADVGVHPSLLQHFLLRGPIIFVLSLIPVIGQLFATIDTLCIFREDRRCIHDLLAGTKVVNDYADYG